MEWVEEDAGRRSPTHLPGERHRRLGLRGLLTAGRNDLPHARERSTGEERRELTAARNSSSTCWSWPRRPTTHKEQQFGAEQMRLLERMWMLHVIDQLLDPASDGDRRPARRHRSARVRPARPAGRVQGRSRAMFDDLLADDSARRGLCHLSRQCPARWSRLRRPPGRSTTNREARRVGSSP